MSRTDLDAVTLASSLRMKAGDGSVEWVYEPIQASVLLDIADMLDDNANLRERITTQKQTIQSYRDESREWREAAEHAQAENAKLRELLQDYHLYEHEDCHSCRYINECRADESGRCIAPMRLGERYREIGVEVDR